MGWPSGAASPSSCVTGFGYTYRLPLVAPATNADLTGSDAFRNATVPVSIVPSRLTLAVKSPWSTEPAGRSLASTRSSTVPGVSGPHDEAPFTCRGVTLLASTVPAARRSVTRARTGERDGDIGCSLGKMSDEHRQPWPKRRSNPAAIRCSEVARDGGVRYR